MWSIVRYLNQVNIHPERIAKTDNNFAKTLDFQ